MYVCIVGLHRLSYKEQNMWKDLFLPVFGIINILLIKSGEPYFVCELLHTEEFYCKKRQTNSNCVLYTKIIIH